MSSSFPNFVIIKSDIIKFMTNFKYKSIKKIPGWLAWTDYEIFREIILFQNTNLPHSIAEIGVHHGKSFIPMSIFSKTRKLYAIDIFNNQEGNIDNSGDGDLKAFIKNLKKYQIDQQRVIIDQRLSTDTKSNDILDKVGKVSFFHIDGGHHYDAVINDINLAVDVSDENSVIVLDDVYRSEWPDVSLAAFSSDSFKNNDFIPFAIGFNKTYFCKKNIASTYQKVLNNNSKLNKHLSKFYNVNETKILIYQRYPLPEWSLGFLFYWYLSVWHPWFYNKFVPGIKNLNYFKKK